MNGVNVTYFESFQVEYIPKTIFKNHMQQKITSNIYRIKADGLRMCGYFCNGFIDFITTLLD